MFNNQIKYIIIASSISFLLILIIILIILDKNSSSPSHHKSHLNQQNQLMRYTHQNLPEKQKKVMQHTQQTLQQQTLPQRTLQQQTLQQQTLPQQLTQQKPLWYIVNNGYNYTPPGSSKAINGYAGSLTGVYTNTTPNQRIYCMNNTTNNTDFKLYGVSYNPNNYLYVNSNFSLSFTNNGTTYDIDLPLANPVNPQQINNSVNVSITVGGYGIMFWNENVNWNWYSNIKSDNYIALVYDDRNLTVYLMTTKGNLYLYMPDTLRNAVFDPHTNANYLGGSANANYLGGSANTNYLGGSANVDDSGFGTHTTNN